MLSGGQRQRIALARALASSPALLILDEATSARDSASRSSYKNPFVHYGSVTVLIIAHRLSTIEHADRLFVLDHGKIVEEDAPQRTPRAAGLLFFKNITEAVAADKLCARQR